CEEEYSKEGYLKKIKLKYPKTFNFAYDVVDKIASVDPNRTALVWCNTKEEEHFFTFEDLRRESNKIANVFLSSGIKKGQKVLVILKRHYEYWFVTLALHKIGAIMIPATHMLTVRDLVYRLNKSNTQAVVCTSFDGIPEKIKNAVKEVNRNIKLWNVGHGIEGFENLSHRKEYEKDTLERIPNLATDPMLLYFTSGTTGYPKGVIHDYSYPLSHIVTAKEWQQAEDRGLHFTVAETGWAKASWGKIYGQWLVGSAVMVYDFDNFDPKGLAKVINKYKVTSFCAPPTVYRYLAKKGIDAMPSLHHASTAGETLAPEVFNKFKEVTGITLCEGYGQTETALIAGNLKGNISVAGSMGKASPLYNVDLVDSEGKPVKTGEIGEVVIIPEKGEKPCGIFSSYLDNQEQYDYMWRGGIYHTGDAAYKDEKGYFWFHGRFDDIIKTSGYRVGPYEIENILMEHPAVLECCVFGIPDSLRGQAIKALVVLNSGYEEKKELEIEIKDYCNQKMAEYKWIRILEFVPSLQKTISGKIKKNVLRDQS
ncbi:MAG: AMP-binding protein, partial [Sphaerochaetaceae bacterium]|nr:AMP-binding protein [Sphaerochaetaceae bacterium]